MSDGEDHRRLRNVIGRPLTPKALAELRPEAEQRADDLADRLVGRVRSMLCLTWQRCFRPHGFPISSVGPTRAERSCWIGRRPPSTGSDRPTNERTKRRPACSRWRVRRAGRLERAAGGVDGCRHSRSRRSRRTQRRPVPHGDHRLPRPFPRHDDQRPRQRRLVVRQRIRSSGSTSGRILGVPGRPSMRPSAWKAR